MLIIIKEGISGQTAPKAGSMIDVLPTILEAMNYELPNDRAGLSSESKN